MTRVPPEFDEPMLPGDCRHGWSTAPPTSAAPDDGPERLHEGPASTENQNPSLDTET